MTRGRPPRRGWRGGVGGLLLLAVSASGAPGAGPVPTPTVVWHPPTPRVGEVGWLEVRGVPAAAPLEGTLAGRPLRFFPHRDGQASLVAIDAEATPGRQRWRLAIAGLPPREGALTVAPRDFPVQRLSLPTAMVDLDPETERRAAAEARRLRAVLGTVSPLRHWRGAFRRPVPGDDPGSGFGARRIINGQPRAPHTGLDFSADAGTPVAAVNAGRVALVAEFFFAGRLVVVDHGLGLHSLYFHLDRVSAIEGQLVGGGDVLGTVG
ncbi:MAG TPA: M23 family metallopeptidase, partial [Vicinamibacteria bacterium]|nr:M23 family metallopeptidase [Vicinamibacteria bacterium]